MLLEDVAWEIRLHQESNFSMTPIFRRKSRIALVLLLATVLYLLVGFVPQTSDTLWGFTYVRDDYDWSKAKVYYPVSEYTPLPTGQPRALPPVQYAFDKGDKSPEAVARQKILTARRNEVKAAFVKSWNSYKRVGFGYDEVLPVSGKGHDVPGFGGWGATLVDSLSTLWIMDLKEDFFEAAAAAVTVDYSRTHDSSCNYFETTIRHLGGLLSAFDLSGERALLEKATELGDMLWMAYDTPNRMPGFWFNFRDAKYGRQVAGYHDPSAAVASSSLEFSRLSQLTGDDKYYDAIDRVTRVLDEWQNRTQLPGMWPTYFDLANLRLDGDRSFTLGALADSLYEYLPKTFALLGGLEPVYEKMYRGAMDAVVQHVLFRPKLPDMDDILFPGDVYVSDQGPRLTAESQHLSCFVGGMFGLGGKLFQIPEHVALAEKLTKGCVWAYGSMPSGIMPEIFDLLNCETLDEDDGACEWSEEEWEETIAGNGNGNGDDNDDDDADDPLPKGYKGARDPRYLLRPEAIESVFLMYRITGKEEYQEMAWTMFQAVRKATETDLAFSSIQSVRTKETVKTDSMESFFLAETLRYYYLVFSPPDLIDLDEFVLNTEAHPLRRPRPFTKS
ncbi:glycoside hydrolase family 47 protein [Xylariaceae sp. FL0594]|nr:glycoside hydrolase family 47 protein [Xylariaceae sp. FL0594]